MKKVLQCFLVIVVLFLGTTVHSKTASEVFDAVSSSVVVIETYDAKGNDQGLGSGVVLSNNVIATNYHVIKDVDKIQVVYKGKQYLATLQYTDWDRDVCTLTVSGINATPVVLGSTSHLKVGARVYAIGAPQGFELTLSEGIISSLREVEGGKYLQISAPISPGSSGGGLFDEEGQLIGLPTFYMAEGQQLNFAVPVEWITELPERHKKVSEVALITYIEWVNKSLALEEKKDWAGLLTHSLRWTEAHPELSWAWFSLGLAYYNTDKFTESIEAFKQVLSINPEYVEAWFILGSVYSETGQYTKAIKAYKQGLSINPEYAEAWYILGLTYDKTGQSAEAIKAFKQALSINPEYVNAWHNLGLAYYKTRESVEAIEAYKQALSINPEFVEAWLNLGILYYITGQSTESINAYNQALSINPEYIEAWSGLGIAYGKIGQDTEAIKAFKQALSINPEYVDAWYNLGITYKASGQTSQVIEVYKVLKTLDSTMADNFFNKYVLP